MLLAKPTQAKGSLTFNDSIPIDNIRKKSISNIKTQKVLNKLGSDCVKYLRDGIERT